MHEMGDTLFYIKKGSIESGKVYKIETLSMFGFNTNFTYFVAARVGADGNDVSDVANSHNYTFYDDKEECAKEWLKKQGLSCGLTDQ